MCADTLKFDRRSETRVSPARPLRVVAVNRYQQPLMVLHDAEALDVSDNGMAIRTSVPIARGATLAVQVGGDDRPEQEAMVVAEVLQRRCDDLGRHVLHCRVVQGPVPMRLVSDRWQLAIDAWATARTA